MDNNAGCATTITTSPHGGSGDKRERGSLRDLQFSSYNIKISQRYSLNVYRTLCSCSATSPWLPTCYSCQGLLIRWCWCWCCSTLRSRAATSKAVHPARQHPTAMQPCPPCRGVSRRRLFMDGGEIVKQWWYFESTG